jgi:AraC-like DNA-binding protein
MADAVADPLHRFPVFRTSDPEELRQFGSTLFGAARIELKNLGHFEARVNLVQLQETALAFGATSAELAIDNLAADFIRLKIAHKGRGTSSADGRTTDINDRQFAITPAGVRSRMVCEAGHERLTLRLYEQALLQRLTALLGAKPKGEMTFQAAIEAGQPYAQSLSQLILFLSQQLDSAAPRLPAAVWRELEQAVQIAFLYASRHTFSHLLERQESMPAPWVVRRIEEFIEAHWQEAITIDRLAAEVGVSTRAIFRAFERSRAYSPMAFAKAIRLKRAREILMSGDPCVSVTGAAFQSNFASPGRFAKDYREAFGELPSETVSRTRRRQAI